MRNSGAKVHSTEASRVDVDDDVTPDSVLTVPTVSSDTDINYILNILDLVTDTVSKEYQSRKNLQNKIVL